MQCFVKIYIYIYIYSLLIIACQRLFYVNKSDTHYATNDSNVPASASVSFREAKGFSLTQSVTHIHCTQNKSFNNCHAFHWRGRRTFITHVHTDRRREVIITYKPTNTMAMSVNEHDEICNLLRHRDLESTPWFSPLF